MAPSLERFDVYISFNQKDAAVVRQIAGRLRDERVSVWLYDWQITGGAKWAVEMKEALERSATSVIFVGAAGLGPQQSQEVLVNIREREKTSDGSFRIIPALLPDADEARLPPFLQERQWVDFRKGIDDEQAFHSLLASIRSATSGHDEDTERAGDEGHSEPPSEGDDDADAAMATHDLWKKKFEKVNDSSAQEVKQKSAPLETLSRPSSEPAPPAPNTSDEDAVEEESIQRASVSDQPSARDTLGFGPYVKALATFLTNEKTRPPLTLSVEGEWGSGKSSFMLQLAEELHRATHRRARLALCRRMSELRAERLLNYTPVQDVAWLRRLRVRRALKAAGTSRCLTVEFNPWRHDKENAMWASFALEFVRKLSQNMSLPERVVAHLRLLLRRFQWKDGWLVLVRMAFLLLIVGFLSAALVSLLRAGGLEAWKGALGGDDKGEWLFRVVQASGVAGYLAVALFFLSKLREFVGNPFAFDLRRYVESPDYEGNIAFIEQFHEDFRKIVETYAGSNTVYVFIDDLDRCDVPKAADLMQAINLMISGGASQLVFIIGMDREKVAAGLAVKNEKLLPYLAYRPQAGVAAKDGGEAAKPAPQPFNNVAFGLEYGYNFIEKFIQIPFSVPQPAPRGVRTLLDFIDPLVEGTSEGGVQAQADAVRKLIEEGVIVVKPSDTGANGNTPETAARDVEDPARDMARAEQNAADILREAGAKIVIDDDEWEPEEKEPEEKEGLMLLERGDSPTVRNIVLMVAPALDYNPRRIKQFINLFRLKAYIAYETGLFRRPKPGSAFSELTMEQLGKFVAICLRWPRLLPDLDDDRGLLQRLQRLANGQYSEPGDQAVESWSKRPELMTLLKFGNDIKFDPFNPKRIGDPPRYSLAALDVGRLLQVSPRVNRPAPPRSAAPNAPQTSPPADPAATPPPETGAGLDLSETATQDAETFRSDSESRVNSLSGFVTRGLGSSESKES